jgi:hypothetical protein
MAVRIVSGVALAFGALTILSSGLALFGGPQVQAAAGNAIPS